MKKYSVKQLAKLAGISIRTLHHYDQIDLLKPSFRSEKGYRFYERKELLLLQQILIYRELDFSLKEIQTIIYDPSFDLVLALETHRKKLKERLENYTQLLKTIDKTIVEIKNKNNMLTDKEIYEGLDAEQIASRRAEVIERWGKEELEAAEKRIQAIGKDGWDDMKKKGEEINHLLADLSDLAPDHVKVQQAIALHFKYLNFFSEVSLERYVCLGKMYTEDERFKSFYEKYKEGLADFIYASIQVFCTNK